MLGPVEGGAPRRHAVKLGIAIMMVASTAVAGLLVPWNDLLSSGGPRPHAGPGGALSWETEGWVKSAAPSTSSIRVSSGFLGLSSLTLVVPLDTLIMVEGKEGGFDDLHEGRRVRAIYETHPSGLRAKSIEVLGDGARPENRRAIGAPQPSTTVEMRSQPRSTPGHAGPSSTPSETRSAPGNPGSSPSSDTLSASKDSGRSAIPRGGPVAQPSSGRSKGNERTTAERRASVPSPPQDEGVRVGNTEPRQTQTADPGAVIDWLLKESPASSQ